jgi:hypothetical protein
MIAPDEQTGWPNDPTHVQVELIVDFGHGSKPGDNLVGR